MISKWFAWIGYLILGFIGLVFVKQCVLPPDNPDSLEYLWGKKVTREWQRYSEGKFSEQPPFILPQKNIKCLDVFGGEMESASQEQLITHMYNNYLITEALKGRVLLIGLRGEAQRLESINSMSCEDKHSLYFNNYVEPLDHEKIEKLINNSKTQ